MSRLIVKNLPKNVTDTRLKEIFSQKGLITDVQLKYTKDGKFRRFCFIGYKTEEQAQAAKEYFDKTCIDTTRISVELCSSLGDPSKPKSWSKYAPDSSHQEKSKKDSKNEEADVTDETEEDVKHKKKKSKNKIKEVLEKHKDDPLFLEFLESHGTKDIQTVLKDEGESSDDGKSTKTVFKSDEENEENINNDKAKRKNVKTEKADEEKKIADAKVISDLEYMEFLKKKKNPTELTTKDSESSKHGPEQFFTVKVRGLGYKHKKKNIKQFFAPLKAKSIRVPQTIKGIAFVGFKTEQHLRKALLKNKSFLDGKQIFVTKYEDKKDTGCNDEEVIHNNNNKWIKQEEALKDEESIAESGRIFLRNLSYTNTEDDIRKLFEKYGPLTEVNLPVDRATRKPKGFGTITFLMPEHAMKAYSELDGSVLNGRMLHLLPGKTKTSLNDILENAEDLTYKQKKDLKVKATANSSHNWNTLFLGQNAVVDAIANAYNTTKEQVLEDGSKTMTAAVKLALGETKLVLDTKNFLEEHGVHLDAFNRPAGARSKTVILVKNLPSQTTVHEIRDMFAKHGELGRIVMPPSGITAIVEFLEPSEARKAFTKLAYTKFKNLPLYLEWAPENSFVPDHGNKKTKDGVTTKSEKKVIEEEKSNEEERKDSVDKMKKEDVDDNDNDDEDEPESDTTIFVKNLNFSTTEDTLKKYFSKCGRVHYAMIATKKDPKVPGSKLSMGYGFVRYKTKSDTDRALKQLQTTELDGKTLELKRSERTLPSEVKTSKKSAKIKEQTGTKILVRNIPFQASQEEVTELFKAYGELKAVRLPRKLTGVEKHRGFGFVEYFTKTEAKKAFKALCQSTHLYGRKLVLEWAQAEEGVEEIRKRTAKHFHQDGPVSKKSKKSTVDLFESGKTPTGEGEEAEEGEGE